MPRIRVSEKLIGLCSQFTCMVKDGKLVPIKDDYEARDQGRVHFFTKGHLFSQNDLKALRRLKIEYVFAEEPPKISTVKTTGVYTDLARPLSRRQEKQYHQKTKHYFTELKKSPKKNQIEIVSDMVANIAEFGEHIKESATLNRGVCMDLALIDQKQDGLSRHCENVGNICLNLGYEFGFPEELLKYLFLMGLLHDVGKLNMPIEILDKPDKLDDNEFFIMKQHPVKGYNFLKSQKIVPTPFLIAILLHHRFPNGRGYPEDMTDIKNVNDDPLADHKIRVITQILTVSDIYDSLTSERAYKPPFGCAEILDILTDMTKAGMLDKKIVKTLLTVVGLYPIGAKVTITSGHMKGFKAVIDANNRKNPPFPMLRITHNEEGIISERGRHNSDRKIPTQFELDLDDLTYFDRGKEKVINYKKLYKEAIATFFA